MTFGSTTTNRIDPREETRPLETLREYYKSSYGYRSHLEAKGPAYFERFVAIVCANSSPSDSILDVGCGTGESTRQIMRHNRNVVGTDLSALFLQHPATPAEGRPNLVVSDALKLPFPDHRFDVVCAFEFIEHIWPVEVVLNEVHRILKPSGRIIITSPNLVSPFWPVRDLPGIVLKKRFRPPFYGSNSEAAAFFRKSCRLTLKKLLSKKPDFVPRTPELKDADGGGDYDAVYHSNARDIMLFLRQRGYETHFAAEENDCLRSWVRNCLAASLRSAWISFTLVATKQA